MSSDLTKGPGPDLRKTDNITADTVDWVQDLITPVSFESDHPVEPPGENNPDTFLPPDPEPGSSPPLTIGQRLRGMFRLGGQEATPSDLIVHNAEGNNTLKDHLGDPASVEDETKSLSAAPMEALSSGPARSLFGRLRRKDDRLGPDQRDQTAPDGNSQAGPVAPAVRRVSGKRKISDPRGYPPIQVLIGWIGESSRKDVLEHARGFATDHIEALDSAWVTMAELRGGTLFEIHEGGGGSAYLPELIEELSRDPDQVLWVPSGTKLNRVVTVSIVENRPFSMMLNEAESARVRTSGQMPIDRTGRMGRLRPRGTKVLVVGGTLFSIALCALISSAFLSARIDQQPIPSLPYTAGTLPHGQIISLSDALREDRWVSRILFEDGSWRAEFETFDELALPNDTEEAQTLIDEAVKRDEILQSERERKVREFGAK